MIVLQITKMRIALQIIFNLLYCKRMDCLFDISEQNRSKLFSFYKYTKCVGFFYYYKHNSSQKKIIFFLHVQQGNRI